MGYSLQHRFHSRSKRVAVPREGPGVKAGVGEDEMGVVGGVGSCLVHWTFDVDVLRVCFFLVAVFDFAMGMGNGHVVVSVFGKPYSFWRILCGWPGSKKTVWRSQVGKPQERQTARSFSKHC